jgi:hypothetical protein
MSENRKVKEERAAVASLPREIPLPRYDFQRPIFGSESQRYLDPAERERAKEAPAPRNLQNVALTF